MYTLKQVIALALVGTAIATPMAHRYRGDNDGPQAGRLPGTFGFGTETVEQVKSEVVTIVVGGNQPAATPAAPVAASTGSVSAPSTGSSSGGYMGIVAKWRAAGGLSALQQSSKLEANALKTANDGNGQMVHELNPGSMGQVLAPGTSSNFEKVYVGGWLCEIDSLPGLNGICSSMAQGWSHDGQRGHAEILTSTKYTQIGCALAKGIWACDLA